MCFRSVRFIAHFRFLRNQAVRVTFRPCDVFVTANFRPSARAAIADVFSDRPFVDVRRDEEIRADRERAEWPGKPFAASPNKSIKVDARLLTFGDLNRLILFIPSFFRLEPVDVVVITFQRLFENSA
jgi:hypothetical protein